MPIYEYCCQQCAHQFDALQKMSDDLLKDCPECKEPALKKMLSAPAFRLSGSGWYETDFKTDKDKRKNLTSTESSKENSKENSKESAAKKDPPAKKTDKPASNTSTHSPAKPASV